MSIDFGKKEAREGYLQAKLDDLLDGINSSYGQALLDELMSRLEATINAVSYTHLTLPTICSV